MLLRIRTELKQTLMSYQELFETSIVWGRQKMVESEMGWEKLLDKKNQLEEEVKQLEKVKRNWMTEVEIITKQMEDEMEELMKLQVLVIIDKGKCLKYHQYFIGNARL